MLQSESGNIFFCKDETTRHYASKEGGTPVPPFGQRLYTDTKPWDRMKRAARPLEVPFQSLQQPFEWKLKEKTDWKNGCGYLFDIICEITNDSTKK